MQPSDELVRLMGVLKMTCEDAAETFDVFPRAISNMRRGERPVTPLILEVLKQAATADEKERETLIRRVPKRMHRASESRRRAFT
jgi:hypothetical protein